LGFKKHPARISAKAGFFDPDQISAAHGRHYNRYRVGGSFPNQAVTEI
jgi:hypothetical protein